MGGAGGGAEALCAVLFTGLPFCIQNLSSQITQPREPPPLDCREAPQRLGPLAQGVWIPCHEAQPRAGREDRLQALNNQLRFEVGKKVL